MGQPELAVYFDGLPKCRKGFLVAFLLLKDFTQKGIGAGVLRIDLNGFLQCPLRVLHLREPAESYGKLDISLIIIGIEFNGFVQVPQAAFGLLLPMELFDTPLLRPSV